MKEYKVTVIMPENVLKELKEVTFKPEWDEYPGFAWIGNPGLREVHSRFVRVFCERLEAPEEVWHIQ